MSDWTPGDEWEQFEWKVGLSGADYIYDARSDTYWRKKPKPASYTPSPEASALFQSLYSQSVTEDDWETKGMRAIDAALEAARQQGYEAGRLYGNGEAFDWLHKNSPQACDLLHQYENSQGAGPATPPEPISQPAEPSGSEGGSGGDGSTVASPLRGTHYDRSIDFAVKRPAIPEGKVLVDRALVRRIGALVERLGYLPEADELRAALEEAE